MAFLDRAHALRDAELKAAALFTEIESLGLVKAGITELELNTTIHQLAQEKFGVTQHWHKRIVRSGANTLAPYSENPANLTIQKDDIVFFDFGPVFAEWEADFGRTYVLGDNPDKLRIQTDIEECWGLGKEHFDAHPKITGAELFAFVSGLARERGWEYGQEHCGHLIGEFPHERIQGESRRNYIHPANHELMRAPDLQGRPRDWILEVHFVDREKQFGGFFEQLLTA